MGHLLSIITINFNDKAGLERTIQSVKEQNFESFEHIIIDGNSNDGSKDLIEINAGTFGYWVSEPDTGIYNAMNKGIKVAKGDFLLFLNSGDWLHHKNVLSTIQNELKGNTLIYGNFIRYYSKDHQQVDKSFEGQSLTLNSFIEGRSIPHPSSFYPRSFFEKYGTYDEHYSIVSDWKYILKLAIIENVQIQYVDQVISNFDMSGRSNTSSDIIVQERNHVLNSLFPKRVLQDYKYLSSLEKQLENPRVKMVLALDKFPFVRKQISMILRIYLRLINRKGVKDL